MGAGTTASGDTSTAMGNRTIASGLNSTAMGNYVSTNALQGSFAIGDFSSGYTTTNNDANNQMMMRFAGGYKLYTDAAATTGAVLPADGNSWATISDVRRKEGFAQVNGEQFLNKIATLSLTSWNYKGQNPATNRHYGPMAQDFYAAFGRDSYGMIGNDTTIGQADMEGVSLIAIQALEKRTRELQAQVAQLQTENAALSAELSGRIKAIETEMKRTTMR